MISPNKKPKGWIPGHLPASEETRKKLSEIRRGKQKTVEGYHIYNNGKIQTMAKKCPKGFKKGMLNKNKNKITSTKDKILINNGTEEKFIFKNKTIPEGWIKGSLSKNKKKGPNKKLKNRKWINNGKENKRIKKNQPIPKGWHIGQLYHNFKASYSTLGRITITNGIKNRFIKPEELIPEGWKRGMTQNHKKKGKK